MTQEKEVFKEYNHIKCLKYKDNIMWLSLSIRDTELAVSKNRYDLKERSNENIEDRQVPAVFH